MTGAGIIGHHQGSHGIQDRQLCKFQCSGTVEASVRSCPGAHLRCLFMFSGCACDQDQHILPVGENGPDQFLVARSRPAPLRQQFTGIGIYQHKMCLPVNVPARVFGKQVAYALLFTGRAFILRQDQFVIFDPFFRVGNFLFIGKQAIDHGKEIFCNMDMGIVGDTMGQQFAPVQPFVVEAVKTNPAATPGKKGQDRGKPGKQLQVNNRVYSVFTAPEKKCDCIQNKEEQVVFPQGADIFRGNGCSQTKTFFILCKDKEEELGIKFSFCLVKGRISDNGRAHFREFDKENAFYLPLLPGKKNFSQPPDNGQQKGQGDSGPFVNGPHGVNIHSGYIPCGLQAVFLPQVNKKPGQRGNQGR